MLTAIPLVGLNYVREMEGFLREGQERSLMALARAAATALHDRPALLEPSPGPQAGKTALQPGPGGADESRASAPGTSRAPAERLDVTAGIALRADTAQASPPLDRPPPGAGTGPAPIGLLSPAGAADLRAGAARRPDTDTGQDIEPVIRGLSRAQSRILVINQQRNLIAATGSLRQDPDAPSPQPSEGLIEWLQVHGMEPVYRQLLQPPSGELEDANPASLYASGGELDSALAGIPASRWRSTTDPRVVLLSAAYPIWNGEQVVGAVVVEESTLPVLSIRYRAFEKLLTTTLLVFILGAVTLFLFASRLSSRLVKLRTEAENAIDAHGRVLGMMKDSKVQDEIGDLARSFSTVLERLAEYNAYLERMADRLSHELRTPVAIVSSSLDNLRQQPLEPAAVTYVERAGEGLKRLNAILTRMREATRLEQMLRDAERESFDLNRVVAGCVEGYASAFPEHQFELFAPPSPVRLSGVPDVIAQMLDKIVENAVDFSAPGTPVWVRIDSSGPTVRLSVENTGPPLPETMQGQLFESMISVREDASGGGASPHLGLGLFMVRLIAEFHGATTRARNRPDGRGVVVEVSFPRADSPAPAAPPVPA